jgi:hypothetical protein
VIEGPAAFDRVELRQKLVGDQAAEICAQLIAQCSVAGVKRVLVSQVRDSKPNAELRHEKNRPQ